MSIELTVSYENSEEVSHFGKNISSKYYFELKDEFDQ